MEFSHHFHVWACVYHLLATITSCHLALKGGFTGTFIRSMDGWKPLLFNPRLVSVFRLWVPNIFLYNLPMKILFSIVLGFVVWIINETPSGSIWPNAVHNGYFQQENWYFGLLISSQIWRFPKNWVKPSKCNENSKTPFKATYEPASTTLITRLIYHSGYSVFHSKI